MPKAFDDLVSRLKHKPGVTNPYALAHSIETRKRQAAAVKRVRARRRR